jgi:hypothetical protein
MTDPDPKPSQIRLRLLAAIVALAAGTVALVVSIQLVKGVLG